MNQNEIDFINFFYTEHVLHKRMNHASINKAYFILTGVQPNDNCTPCISARLQGLKNTYITLIKIRQPEEIVEDKVFLELKASKTKKRYDVRTIPEDPTV